MDKIENKESAVNFRESWRVDDAENAIEIQNDGSIFIDSELGSLILPIDYKTFITKYPGGITPTDEDNFIFARFEDESVEVQLEYLYSLESAVSDYSSQYESTFDDGANSRLPSKHLIIASGLIDDFVLNVDPESTNFGKVYNWTRAGDSWGTGDNTEGLGLVASDFVELMNNLTEESNIE